MGSKNIGFIGLGAMGMAMARQLLSHGFAVTGYDIKPEAGADLAGYGGTVADNAKAAAAGADILFLMVFNADQIDQALFESGAIDVLSPGAVIIASSTVAPPFMRDLGDRLGALGFLFIDGPVSGGVPAAQEGTLTMMAAGPSDALAKAGEALRAVTSTLYHLSEQAGVGSYVKAVNQLLEGVHVAVAAEGMALGTRAGADPRVLYDVICASAGSSLLFERKVPQMLDANFLPAKSAVEIWVKDLGAVLDAGRELRFPLPLTSAAHQLYLAMAASGHSQEDYSSVVKYFETIAGISVATAAK